MSNGHVQDGKRTVTILAFVLLAGVFYLLSLHNYLLFHALVELSAAVTAFTLFSIGWNTRRYARNNLMLVFAVGYLIVGAIDVLHLLSFKGMGIFPHYGANLPTQFWIAARYMEAVTVVTGALCLGEEKSWRAERLLAGFLAAGVVLTTAIFMGLFPPCYIDGQGLTPFKIAGEYFVSAGFLAAGVIIYQKRIHLTGTTLRLLLMSFGLTVLSEMSFTLYVDVYGFVNALGHLFKLFSIILVYFALIAESLQSPYQLLFREIAAANEKLERDISERRNAEQALRKSEQKFRTYVEMAPLGIFVVDRAGCCIEVNPQACRISGYPEDELLLLNFPLFLSSDSPEGLKIYHQAKQDGFAEGEIQIRNKNGDSVWLHVTAVRMAGGRLIAFCCDITANKQAEQKLADYAMSLELAGIKMEELCRKLEEEMDNARHIHEQTMRGNLPEVKGVAFAAHYQPALKLGGDFYKVMKSGDKLVIYLSDVSGHGLEGAILSVFVKEAIDSYVSLKPDDIRPRKILQHLYQQYCQENYSEEHFISIFLAVYHLKTHVLTYTAAGFQDKPLVCLGDGRRTKLCTEGLPISSVISPDLISFEEKSLTLTPGTTVFFHTDGLTEQRSAESCYGERLPGVFFEHSHLPPHLLARTICDDFSQFNNGSLQGKDDITFLVMQINTIS